MILGMTPLTFVHVVLSLVGIVAGFVVLYGLLTSRRLDRWTATFLATTVATSVTGFLFPVQQFLPSHAIGILSLIVLAVAIVARYSYGLRGGWRKAYVLSSVTSLYFNVFVLVVQLFLKVPTLKALAPTQSEPPFAIAQLAVLAAFVVFAVLSAKRFQVEPIGRPVHRAGAVST